MKAATAGPAGCMGPVYRSISNFEKIVQAIEIIHDEIYL
jgi:hypothetical protein